MLANRDKTVVARYPLHTLQAIVSFSYAGASPCADGQMCGGRDRSGLLLPRTDVSLPTPAARAAATYCSAVSSTVSLTTPLAAVR